MTTDPNSEERRTSMLFAVSDFDDTDAELQRASDADLVHIDVVTAAARGTYLRSHRADLPAARLWLAHAASASAADIDAMPGEAQAAAVASCWVAFGNACRALNLRPQVIAAFRRACQRAWGYWSEASDVHANVVRHFKGYQWRAVAGTLPPQFVREAADGVAPPLGLWRAEVMRQGGSVVFGELDLYGFGGLNDLGNEDPTRATGERHRLWLTTRGLVVEDMQNSAPLDWHPAEPERRNWRSFAASTATTNPRPQIAYVPPLRAYWDLLRAPQQDLRPAGFQRDLSVVDFLRVSLSTDASAREFLRSTWRAMIARNNDTAAAWDLQGMLSGVTARRAALADLRQQEADRETDQAIAGGISGVVGAVATAAIGPAGVLVGGVVRLGGEIFTGVLTRAQAHGFVDVFGRLCPVFEQFEIVQDTGGFLALQRDPIMRLPTPPPRGLPPVPTMLEGPLFAPVLYGVTVSTPVTVRVVGMPQGGALTIDGADAIAGGTWEDDTEAVWITRTTPGRHTVTVAPQGGAWTVTSSLEVQGDGGTFDVPAAHARAEARGLLGGASPDGAPADPGTDTPPTPRGHMTDAEKAQLSAATGRDDLTRDAGALKDGGTPPLPRTATLAIVHMPPYGGLFVDGVQIGADAAAWQDEAETVYATPVTIGRHAVRVTPPDGSWERTATLDVTAAGAVLDVSPAPAQRPAAPPGGSSTSNTRGMLLAGAVGLGALAVVAAVASSD